VRVALFARHESANGLYRGVLPMSALRRHGHEVLAIDTAKHRPSIAQLAQTDVLHVHRYCDRAARKLMLEAKAQGATVVWDNDDDAGSDMMLAYRRDSPLVWQRGRSDVNQTIQVSDLVTTPSKVLAECLHERGARRVAVVESYIPRLFLSPRGAYDLFDGVTIGWMASSEHQYDAEQTPIVPVLQRLLDERSDVRVVTIGVALELQSDRYRHIKGVRFIEQSRRRLPTGASGVSLGVMTGGLTNHLAQFDIGIAPLADSQFNEARSNIKLKEYAAAGAVWLASPRGPYLEMGEDQGGRLVADNDWFEAITRLIVKRRERAKLAKRAAKWATGQTIEQNAYRWDEIFREAISRRAEHH
jgi:glycosyltransferase involved in cell wall biosynthesis